VDDLWSPAGGLPVHRDQLRAQRPVSSMGKPLLFSWLHDFLGADQLVSDDFLVGSALDEEAAKQRSSVINVNKNGR